MSASQAVAVNFGMTDHYRCMKLAQLWCSTNERAYAEPPANDDSKLETPSQGEGE